jgi:hypothetical protein
MVARLAGSVSCAGRSGRCSGGMAVEETHDQAHVLTSRLLQARQSLANMLDLLVAAVPEPVDMRQQRAGVS